MTRFFLSILLIIFVCIHDSFQATLKVPEEYSSIQSALDSASQSDTVLVAPGTYVENLLWPSTDGIKLLSTAGAESTIVEVADTGSVCGIHIGVDTTTIIRGFTFRNGETGGM